MISEIRGERKPNYSEVRTETGKSWLGWLEVLDREGSQDIQCTVIYLCEYYGLNPAWARAIAEYHNYVT